VCGSYYTLISEADWSSAYTGYIDIEARHLFFYFFESRNDPDTDDVIFWTNGGLQSQPIIKSEYS
jgi:carboxypeptidase C (cathepsin A)